MTLTSTNLRFRCRVFLFFFPQALYMTLVSALIIMRLGEFRRPVCESPFRRRPAFFGPTYTKVYELDAGTRTRRRPSRSLENHAAGVLLAFVRHLNKYPPLNTPGPPQTWASARREDRQTVLTSRPARRPSVLSSVTPSSTRSVSSLSLSLPETRSSRPCFGHHGETRCWPRFFLEPILWCIKDSAELGTVARLEHSRQKGSVGLGVVPGVVLRHVLR